MTEEPIALPLDVSNEVVATIVDSAIATVGLLLTLHDTLRQYPRCLHWRVEPPGARGTLEITFLPAQWRAWFSVQQRRQALWIADTLAQLQRAIEQRFEASDGRAAQEDTDANTTPGGAA